MTGTTEPLEFRPLRQSDVPSFLKVIFLGIGKLERATGLDRSAGAMVRQLSRRSTWILLGLLRLIGRSPVEVYVAADRDRIAGTGTLLLFRKTGYVAGMVTGPEYRGRGVASRILEMLREAALRRHREWVVLDVESDNEAALPVYRRAGYREVVLFAWYTRPGLPPTSVPTTPGPCPATRGELKRVAPTLDEGRPADYRAALPATPRMISHSELLLSGKGVKKQTWIHRSSRGSTIVLRVGYGPDLRLGIYYPATGPTPPTPSCARRPASCASA